MKHEIADRFFDIAKEQLENGLELNVEMTPSAVCLSHYQWGDDECIGSTSLYFYTNSQSFLIGSQFFKSEGVAVQEFLRRLKK